MARAAAASVLVLACAVSASAQSAVSIRFDEGLVTLSARNAPLAAILVEWARIGGARIVHAERVTGPPLTLAFTQVPEREAIDVLLRGVAGYIATLRPEPLAGRSTYDRILILPTSAGVRPSPSPVTPTPPDPLEFEFRLREVAQREAASREAARLDAQREGTGTGPSPALPASPREPTADPSSSSFGDVPGSARPGEITPSPQGDTPRSQPR